MRTARIWTTLSSTLFAAAALVAAAVPAAAAGPSNAGPVADTRFGVAEGFRNPAVMADIGAGWERLILPWDQIQPAKAGDFSKLGQTLTKAQIQGELNRGTRVAGLFQFTPEWAAVNPGDGKRSVPKNLSASFDDPNNYFGQYVYQTVKYYAGQIDQWIVWNEPEFKPGDPGAGGSYTWLGSDAEFAQMLKVAYLATKKANPNAVVSFPGTSYWVDINSNRPLFYDRVLSILAQDPSAAANNYYHDVVSLNLYRAPDDVYRVHGVFKSIQSKYGINKPVWLTETNAMPSDDTSIPCADKHNSEAIKTTMDQQAAYAIQGCAQGRRQQLRWLHECAVRPADARDGEMVGLAGRCELARAELAGLSGGLRQARQPACHRALEWRRRGAAGTHSKEWLQRAADRSARQCAATAGQSGLVGCGSAGGDGLLQD